MKGSEEKQCLGQTYRETCNPRRTLDRQKTGHHETVSDLQELTPGLLRVPVLQVGL